MLLGPICGGRCICGSDDAHLLNNVFYVAPELNDVRDGV
jgi:hypothetical protein